MTRAPRQKTTLRRVLHWVAGGTVAAQMATMAGLVVFNGVRRRGRRPYRFPTAPVESLEVGDHQVEIFTFGRDLYAAMIADIEAAQHTIYLETFIWKNDEVGRQFRQALVTAAARGVEVYAMWDTFANLVVDPRFFRELHGVHVRAQPLVTPSWMPTIRNMGRDHRKLLVVDSGVAYIGGYNIGSLYADRWRDTHARITGPAVGELENTFVDMWNQRPKGALVSRRNQPVLPSPGVRYWDTPFVVHRNSPRMAVYPIRNMYLEAIDRASERIWMTQGYLIPDDDVVAALHQATSRGVDVRIVIPAES
ncbi:MAG: phospholipase D-like domain-containing protein, partial [Cutibacterium avidum]|nr:phospholipase D-like domain-containing protein [Cutibacterium avidum]